MKAFLWIGTNVVQGGECLMVWSRVKPPLHLGGLGILDLKLIGMALRLRWLWLLHTNTSRPWAVLPLKEDLATMAFFRASTQIVVGNGNSLIFWSDPWLEGQCISEFAPDLIESVTTRRRGRRTLALTLPDHAWTRDITSLLTVSVLMQYLQVREKLGVTLDPNTCDHFV
jgi:hypothetical protein